MTDATSISEPGKPSFRVKEARFLRSAPSLAALGAAEGHEVAFLGRSNVGKSSLLGVLLDRSKLVRVSREPGRTRDINLFHVELARVQGDESETRSLILIDLPGYGYAKASLKERARMSALISSYLRGREGLVAVCQLFDLRHAPSAADREVHNGLRGAPYAHVRVATKADKLPLARRKTTRKELAKELGCRPEDVVLFSAPERSGREEIWERLWEHLP